MPKVESVRWGVMGLGWFGEVHAETLAAMPGIELVALCTRRPDRLAELADRFGVSKRYTDYRELLGDPDVQAVSIVTHYYDHAEIAIDALRAGKHVLLEKPMAAPLESALGLWPPLRRQTDVGHICRFDPRVVLAKQAIEAGRIGRIVSMHARRNLSKTIGRIVLDKISALIGDGVHDADLMLWVTGARPVSVYGGRSIRGPIHIRMSVGRCFGSITARWAWWSRSGIYRKRLPIRSTPGWKSSARKGPCILTVGRQA